MCLCVSMYVCGGSMVSGPLAKFSRIHSHNQLTALAYRFSTLTKWENDSGDNRGVCHFVLH